MNSSFVQILEKALYDIKQYVTDNMAAVAYLKEIERTLAQNTLGGNAVLQPITTELPVATSEAEVISYSTLVAAYGLTTGDRWKWAGYSRLYNLQATKEKVIAAAKFLDEISQSIKQPFTFTEAGVNDKPVVVAPETNAKKKSKNKGAAATLATATAANDSVQTTAVDTTESKSSYIAKEIVDAEIEDRLKSLMMLAITFVSDLSNINDGSSIGSLDNEAKALVETLKWMSEPSITSSISKVMNYEHETGVDSTIDQSGASAAQSHKDSAAVTSLVQQILTYLLIKVAELELDACKVKQKVKYGFFETVERHSAKDIKAAFLYAIGQLTKSDLNLELTADERLQFILTQVNSLVTVCNEKYGFTTSISFVSGVNKQLEAFKLVIDQLKTPTTPALRMKGYGS